MGLLRMREQSMVFSENAGKQGSASVFRVHNCKWGQAQVFLPVNYMFFTNLLVLGNLQTKPGEGRIFKDKYLVFREQWRGMQVKMVRWRSPGRVL